MADINSYLDNITSSIKQLRQDLNDLQLEERPSEKSGLHASRPTTGLRTGDRYFSTDTGAYEYYTGSAWIPVVARSWVVLDKICRVFDDSTSRASGFSNTAVQVTGVTDLLSGWTTLPATLRAVEYNVLIFTAAASTGVSLAVENPDAATGSRVMQGFTASDGAVIAYSAGGVTSLSSLGRLSFTFKGTANMTRIIINITSYMV